MGHDVVGQNFVGQDVAGAKSLGQVVMGQKVLGQEVGHPTWASQPAHSKNTCSM